MYRRKQLLQVLLLTTVTTLLFTGRYAYSSSNAAANLDDLKTAFIYNFLKHITYPESFNSQEMILCARGSIHQKLKKLHNKKVKSATLKVISDCNSERETSSHMIYFDDSFVHTKEKLSQLKNVTVSSSEGFSRNGGIFEFKIEEKKLRFIINRTRADALDIKISSQLLKLALRVE